MTGQSTPPRNLADALRRRREELGWSQVHAAENLGTTQTTYHRWETGASLPRKPADLRQLARWLNLTTDALLHLTYMPEPDAPDHIVEERLAQAEVALAEVEGNNNLDEVEVGDAATLARLTLARVRRIEAMFEEVAGPNGRLHRLEEILDQVLANQRKLDELVEHRD